MGLMSRDSGLPFVLPLTGVVGVTGADELGDLSLLGMGGGLSSVGDSTGSPIVLRGEGGLRTAEFLT